MVRAGVIGSTIVSALEGLNLHFPHADKAALREFDQVRKALENEGEARAKAKSQKASRKKPSD
jgi:hypothetical protein